GDLVVAMRAATEVERQLQLVVRAVGVRILLRQRVRERIARDTERFFVGRSTWRKRVTNLDGLGASALSVEAHGHALGGVHGANVGKERTPSGLDENEGNREA